MEIIFLLISIIIASISVYLLGRTVHSHSNLVKALKRSEELLIFTSFSGVMLALLFFMMLCAFNNTFWHLPYYFN